MDGISINWVRHGNIITIKEEVRKRGREFEKVRKRGEGLFYSMYSLLATTRPDCAFCRVSPSAFASGSVSGGWALIPALPVFWRVTTSCSRTRLRSSRALTRCDSRRDAAGGWAAGLDSCDGGSADMVVIMAGWGSATEKEVDGWWAWFRAGDAVGIVADEMVVDIGG